MTTSSLLLILVAASSPGCTLADLPVHCLRHQVAGEWEFSLGPLGKKRSSCGHQSPDDENQQPKIALTDLKERKLVTLAHPNSASTKKDPEGTWTMIYDEGFEVNVEGLSFFAFSRFDLLNEDGQKHNVSHCGESQVGWYHTQDRSQWGCYFAKKTTTHADYLVQLRSFVPGESRKSISYDLPLPAAWHESAADSLNGLQNGWTAKAYNKFAGKSPRDLNEMAGLRRSMPLSDFHIHSTAGTTQQSGIGAVDLALSDTSNAPNPNPFSLMTMKRSLRSVRAAGAYATSAGSKSRVLAEDDDAERLALEEEQEKEAEAAKVSGQFYEPDISEIPKEFHWGDVDGRNYLEPVLDQGECGSCYAVSTTRMLSARHKIRLDDPHHVPFSISFPLYCAEYNQGCNGGYAFLASKWSRDVGLLPKDCAVYNTGGSCKVDCKVSEIPRNKRYRADKHRYIGGWYGASNHNAMLHELYHNGPIVVSLEPKSDLMYYSGGVYKSGKDPVHQEWERVDHAVLLVGFGETEAGEKYWVLQNSWGEDWGEDGYFRMARGINDSGVESISVAADVVPDDRPEVLEDFVSSLTTV